MYSEDEIYLWSMLLLHKWKNKIKRLAIIKHVEAYLDNVSGYENEVRSFTIKKFNTALEMSYQSDF